MTNFTAGTNMILTTNSQDTPGLNVIIVGTVDADGNYTPGFTQGGTGGVSLIVDTPTDLNDIPSPANGQAVYVRSTNSVWVYDGTDPTPPIGWKDTETTVTAQDLQNVLSTGNIATINEIIVNQTTPYTTRSNGSLVNKQDLETYKTSAKSYVDTQNAAQDTVINAKADKSYVDTQDNLKADKSTTYTKTEVDNIANTKVNTTTFNSSQSAQDTLISGKVDQTTFATYQGQQNTLNNAQDIQIGKKANMTVYDNKPLFPAPTPLLVGSFALDKEFGDLYYLNSDLLWTIVSKPTNYFQGSIATGVNDVIILGTWTTVSTIPAHNIGIRDINFLQGRITLNKTANNTVGYIRIRLLQNGVQIGDEIFREMPGGNITTQFDFSSVVRLPNVDTSIPMVVEACYTTTYNGTTAGNGTLRGWARNYSIEYI